MLLLYAWPLLRRMGGGDWREPRRFPTAGSVCLSQSEGRPPGILARLAKETPTGLAVDKFARDGSGLISGLREADGLIDIPEDVVEVKAGDQVAFIPFSEFGITR